jgi:hypothetical protein
MYNGGGAGAGGSSRPPTAQQPEMRYANTASPRPPTRPYTPNSAAYQQPPQQPQQDPYYRPATQGSAQLPPPSTGYSNAPGFDTGRRPSMPTPVYDRPSYSRGNSPARFDTYNDSQDDCHNGGGGGGGYGPTEETYPLTAYQQGTGTPGTPYDAFEGDTGHQYPPILALRIVQLNSG